MDSPGVYPLTAAVTTAGTQTTDWIDSLEGMLAMSASIALSYGSGGTSIKVYLQTSFDAGVTAQDVACAAFTTSSATKQFNISGLTAVTSPATPTDGALSDNTCVDGFLGPMYRLKVVSVGTYAGSTLVSTRIVAR
jgi:hypothetical protein